MCINYFSEEQLKALKNPSWFRNLKKLEEIIDLIFECNTLILKNSDEGYVAYMEYFERTTKCYKCGKPVEPEEGFRLRVAYECGELAEETRVFHNSHFCRKNL